MGGGMLQPGGRGADLPTPVGEMARDEVGRVQRMIAAAQGNINRAAAQIRQRFAEMQLQVQRGVFVADAPQGALKGGGVRHAGRRGKAHLTGNLGLEIGEGEAGIVQGRIEAAAIRLAISTSAPINSCTDEANALPV